MTNANAGRVAAFKQVSLARDGRPSLYDQLGGEASLRRLVETFYDIIEFEPDGAPIKRLHLLGHGIAHSREEQFRFMSGFLGGPALYVQKYGHSNVREMHLHVRIDDAAKTTWLHCMQMALERSQAPADVAELIMVHLRRVAAILVNREA